MHLGGTTSSYEAAAAANPEKMRELELLFRELGIVGGNRAILSRLTLQANAGFPMLARKAELLEMHQKQKARELAGSVMTKLFPPVAPPEELAAAKAAADREAVKKAVPTVLAMLAGGALYFIL